jgi:integrase
MRGEGRIFQRGKTWWIGYYAPGPNGKRIEKRESSCSEDRRLAVKLLKLRNLERDMAQLRGRKYIGATAEKVTVKKVLDALEADYAMRQIKSLRSARYHLNPVRQHFDGWKALAVTTDAARNYVAKRRAQGRTDATIDRELELLRASFRLAVREEVLGSAPEIPSLKSRKRNKRRVFVTLQEVADFLPVAESLSRDGFDYYRYFFLSGLRPVTLRGLEWKDFDPEAWTLAIRDENDKNEFGRLLAVEGELRLVIESRLARRYPGCSWIFHREGNRLTDTWVRRFFNAVCSQVGIATGRKLGGKVPYDLKKTALRTLRQAGVSEERSMIFSGHKTAQTFRDYAITDDTDQRADLRSRDAYLDAKMPESRPSPAPAALLNADRTRTN